MTAVSTSPFNISMLRKRNTWYTIADGNWSDPKIWMSNGTKKHTVPQADDDVYVNHSVVYDNSNVRAAAGETYNSKINNLFVNGIFKFSSGLNQSEITVKGNLQCNGTFDLSTGNSGGGFYVKIYGVNNYINNFIPGDNKNSSTIYYLSSSYYIIMDLNYYNLQIGGSGVKTIYDTLSVNGTLTIDSNATFELGANDSILNNIVLNSNSKLSKIGFGIVNITNLVNNAGIVSFTNSPVINLYGNISGDLRNGVNFGTGTFNILSNSTWAFSSAGNVPVSIGKNNFVISSSKTLTLNGIAGWLNDGNITGENSNSVLNVVTSYAYGNANEVMPVGIFNYNYSNISKIYIQSGVVMDIPFMSFYDLEINGTATLSHDITINHALTVNGIFQLSSHNLTNNGTCVYNGSILKSGPGIVNLGTMICQGNGKIDFSLGNPSVNLSGNISGDVRNGFDFGMSTVNIMQSLSFGLWTSANFAPILNTSFLIASGKTFTNIGQTNVLGGINVTGTIEGADGTAVFDNRSVCIYNNSFAPMTTGKLFCNQAPNIFNYALMGNQDVQVCSDPIPGYSTLIISGSGKKKILGDISVKSTYTLTAPATIDNNGYSITNP